MYDPKPTFFHSYVIDPLIFGIRNPLYPSTLNLIIQLYMPHVTPTISSKQGIPLGYNTPLRAISGKQNISKPQNMRPPAKQRTPASSLRGQPSLQNPCRCAWQSPWWPSTFISFLYASAEIKER